MQQNNSWDCGIFAIANAFSIAQGLKPETIVYTGNMRKEILSIIQSCSLRPLTHRKIVEEEPSFKALNMYGRVNKMNILRESQIAFLTICHCQIPESWSDTIMCNFCHSYFHAYCYLVKASSVVDKDSFVCYNCRLPGISSQSSPASTDEMLIQSFCKFVEKLPNYHLNNLLSVVVSNFDYSKKSVISNKKEYNSLLEIFKSYDINSYIHEIGNVFVTVKNYYSTAIPETSFSNILFDSLTQPQRVHLVLLIIKLFDKKILPSINP